MTLNVGPLVAILTLASFAFATATLAEPRCANLNLSRTFACEQTGAGVVIAETTERARQLADFARQGEVRFRRHFSDQVAPYAIYFVDTPHDADRDALNRQGAAFVLPWRSGEQLVREAGPALRPIIEKQLEAQGIPRQMWNKVVDQYIAKLPAELNARAGGLVPHELGHLWLVHGYWPKATLPVGSKHYGGPAPDWLDELAAVMMEDDQLKAHRRGHLKSALAGTDPKLSKPWPLAEFLTMTHPNARTGDSTVSSGIAISQPSPTGLTFYAQAQGFADFVLARSNNDRAFDAIARALAANERFDTWLARDGAKYGLGSTLRELEAHWSAWLRTLGDTK